MSGPGPETVEARSRRRLAFVVASAVIAIAWTLAARGLGPSDVWDQTQPKTLCYTTDILVHGHWILPVERAALPATKPPLYNWLAAPAVAVTGFDSELGHKLPSVLALLATGAVVLVAGRRLGRGMGWPAAETGWLAVLVFTANYTMFKLGYLARPDMLLTLWLVVGWFAATIVMIERRAAPEEGAAHEGRLVLVFWLATGLAGLTKGPAALTLVVFAVLAGRFVAGRWSALRFFRWWWGLPLALGMAGAWLVAVGLTDPGHLRDELWYNEIYGRVTGLGPEGSLVGPRSLVTGIPAMALYYVTRFLPWSIVSIVAIVALWRRPAPGAPRAWREAGEAGAILQASAVFIVATVGFYTISAGKRADYVAATFAPGALLAVWALWRLHRRGPWLIPTVAAVILLAMTVYNEAERPAPGRGYGDAQRNFALDIAAVRDETGLSLVFLTDLPHVQALAGESVADGEDVTRAAIRSGEPCLVALHTRWGQETDPAAWLDAEAGEAATEVVVRSPAQPERAGDLREMLLVRVR